MKITKNIFIIGALFCVAALVVYFIAINSAKSQTPNGSIVSVHEVKKSMDAKEKATIVDVRTPEEYKEGHLKNSVLLTVDVIDPQSAQALPDKDQTLYVYCRTGHRSARAVAQLQQMGYAHVHSMDGGITAWGKAGFQIVK